MNGRTAKLLRKISRGGHPLSDLKRNWNGLSRNRRAIARKLMQKFLK